MTKFIVNDHVIYTGKGSDVRTGRIMEVGQFHGVPNGRYFVRWDSGKVYNCNTSTWVTGKKLTLNIPSPKPEPEPEPEKPIDRKTGVIDCPHCHGQGFTLRYTGSQFSAYTRVSCIHCKGSGIWTYTPYSPKDLTDQELVAMVALPPFLRVINGQDSRISDIQQSDWVRERDELMRRLRRSGNLDGLRRTIIGKVANEGYRWHDSSQQWLDENISVKTVEQLIEAIQLVVADCFDRFGLE